MTTTNKPRWPARFVFQPAGIDSWRPTANQPAAGAIVIKVQPFGCPRNGTMGHCYVRPVDDATARNCLVLLNSLTPVKGA